jgi:hypothetical protein
VARGKHLNQILAAMVRPSLLLAIHSISGRDVIAVLATSLAAPSRAARSMITTDQPGSGRRVRVMVYLFDDNYELDPPRYPQSRAPTRGGGQADQAAPLAFFGHKPGRVW